MDAENTWTCPLCGAVSTDGRTCEEQFHAFLFLEAEQPRAGIVHHLMVTSYMLQHNAYSEEARTGMIQLLEDWLEKGISPQETRQRMRKQVDSGNRDWKITGSSAAHFTTWPITAMEVNSTDPEAYITDVTAWATSILNAIRAHTSRN